MGNNITIVGAGLAGSLLSVYLAKRGYTVDLYERRPDMRQVKISAGRSINLALSTRGIHALKEVGLFDEISKILIPMKGRMMHGTDGAQTFVPYGKDDTEVINSVSRGELNMRLMSLAESFPGVKIHFNQRCTGMNFETGEAFFTNESNGEKHSILSERVIGTDGSASALRSDMMRLNRFNYSQSYLEHAYKELTIPPAKDGSFRLVKNALHIWPRKTFMLIALPNTDASFTCTLFLSLEGPESFSTLDTPEKVTLFFKKYFPDALEQMPDLTDHFFENPTSYLMTVKSFPWSYEDKVVLLGDASHAIVPFFGQGMNCSFEDCSELNRFIGTYPGDWKKIFKEFEKSRKPNSDAIADLAVENFYEMRDLVADPRFLLKKKVEHILEEKFPDYFVPKYAMVTFHRIPYSVAMERGKIQDIILGEITTGIHDPHHIDIAIAEHLIKTRLTPWSDVIRL